MIRLEKSAYFLQKHSIKRTKEKLVLYWAQDKIFGILFYQLGSKEEISLFLKFFQNISEIKTYKHFHKIGNSFVSRNDVNRSMFY